MATQRKNPSGTGRTRKGRESGPGISRGLTAEIVLETAEVLIAKQGLAAFRVRDVAEALDVQPQAIYNYFDGREGLIGAVSEKFTRDVVEAMTVPEGTEPWDEVRLSARNLAAYFCTKPSAAYLVLADMGQWNLSQSGAARDIDLAYQRHVTALLTAGAEAGIFRPMRTSAYLSFVIIGIAANVLWNDRHGNLKDGTAVPDKIVQQEAVDLVVSLLTPRLEG